jgi:hypothetical protein
MKKTPTITNRKAAMGPFIHLPSRRQFAASAGAGLLLSPFLRLGSDKQAHAAAKKSKRLLLFCTMGTNPSMWTPTGISGETITTFSKMTEPLAAIKDSIVLVEGMPTGNISNGHGAPDALTGMGHGWYNGALKISVDQFVASKLPGLGVNRPIASLLLGANTSEGSNTMFYGGAANGGNNLPTIGSPLSAFTTVFGGALPTGVSASSLLKRRQSMLDIVKNESMALRNSLGTAERAKLDRHLDSVRQLENKLTASMMPTTGTCMKPATPGADSTFTYMSALDGVKVNQVHLDIIANAFACDITRVASIQFGNDQKFMVNLPGRLPYDDQHGGFIHSGASTNFKNLVEFERYLAEQFVAVVNKLKGLADPEEPAKTLFDTTLIAWCRDMGDAVAHDQKSMRFVLASGAGGYLKTAAGGRYIKSTERHERILLNIIDAMGITSFAGFGDPGLPTKMPLANIAAA